MKPATPITDRLVSPACDFVPNTKVLHVSHARVLELDREALMEALEAMLDLSYAVGINSADTAIEQAESALTAARASFPTPTTP